MTGECGCKLGSSPCRPLRSRRPALRHRHDADPGDAARDGRRGGRRRRVRRGPDGQPARSRSPPRCSARRPRSTCRRGRWPTSSRCGCSGRRGTEVLCGERAHVFRYEAAAAAGNAGVQLRPLPDADGVFGPRAVETAAADRQHHLPPISRGHDREHPHARERPAVAGRRGRRGRRRGAAVTASRCTATAPGSGTRPIALGVARPSSRRPPTRSCSACRRVSAAPIGSLLCGPAATIAAAREERARLGGGMRQAGVIAAAGIVALETMVERLADDHARARRLAEVLAERFPGSIDPAAVETNIVCAPLERPPRQDRRAARRARRASAARSTRAPHASSRTRTSTTTDLIARSRVDASRLDATRPPRTGELHDGPCPITGCSTGFGRAAAVELTKRGHDVVATARRPETLDDLDVAQTLTLDVDDDASVAAAVAAAGEVDALVNNAGFGVVGPVEQMPMAGGTADLGDQLLRRVADDPGRRAGDAARGAAGRS